METGEGGLSVLGSAPFCRSQLVLDVGLPLGITVDIDVADDKAFCLELARLGRGLVTTSPLLVLRLFHQEGGYGRFLGLR